MSDLRAYDEHVEAHFDGYVQELIALARRQSVSATGVGIPEMAQQVSETFARYGAKAEVLNPGGAFPVLFAEFGQGERSLLLYDHYDTQPEGPHEAWHSPPFEPEIRHGKLFGRGIGDDKGEFIARLQALQAYQQVVGELPLRVKYIVEGAHEIGSPGLAEVVQANRARLQADGCISEGLGRDSLGNFAIYLGCRGFAYVELSVALRDYALASMYGGILPNPALTLARALISLNDAGGDLALEGLDEWVVRPTAEELEALERLPFDEARLKSQLGASQFVGNLSGARLLRRYIFDPYSTICSMTSCDAADGLALPGTASARLDIRLVPNLEPSLIAEQLRLHLDRHGFPEVQVKLLAGTSPDRCPADAPVVGAAVAAAQDLTGEAPILYPLMPAYSASRVFHQHLETPVIFAGAVTNDDSNLHGPNENITLTDYLDYLKYLGRLISRLG